MKIPLLPYRVGERSGTMVTTVTFIKMRETVTEMATSCLKMVTIDSLYN